MTSVTRCAHVPLVLLALTFAATAQAVPIDYTITFNSNSSSATPVGFFTYDAEVPQFSNFHVMWNGVDFDLTDGANSPNPNDQCGAKLFGPAVGFAIMSGSSPCPVEQLWSASADGVLASFSLFATSVTSGPIDEFDRDYRIETVLLSGVASSVADGTFTIAQSTMPVPEPASLALLGAGLAGLVTRRVRRR